MIQSLPAFRNYKKSTLLKVIELLTLHNNNNNNMMMLMMMMMMMIMTTTTTMMMMMMMMKLMCASLRDVWDSTIRKMGHRRVVRRHK